MKNLAHLPIDVIEEKYPHIKSRQEYWEKSSTNHRTGDYWSSRYIKWTVKKFLGKPFADAFAYYCSKVPVYQQHKFLEEFVPSYCSQTHDLRIDENGNLQLTEGSDYQKWIYGREPKPAIWKSPDVDYELRHKVTGHPQEHFKEVWSYKEHWEKWIKKWCTVKDKLLYYEYGGAGHKTLSPKEIYRAKKSDFESVLIEGEVIEFESKQDSKFKRLHTERRKGKSKDNRRAKRAAQEKQYSFLCQSEIEKKKQKELNDLTITRHGFDLVTSFRGQQKSA